jgi:hypothetical protein
MISKHELHFWYNYYNRELFSSRLPKAEGKEGAWVTYGYKPNMGEAYGKTTSWRNSNGRLDADVRILIAYDLRRRDDFVRQTLIHEMIHADLFRRKIDRNLSHGRAFKKESLRIFKHPEYLRLFGVH